MKYEELLALKSLGGIKPTDQVHIVGNLFDLSFDHNNLSGIEHAFMLSEQIDIQTLDDESFTVLNYDLSNGWSYIRKLKYHSTNDDWSFQIKELFNEIFFQRKAIDSTGFDKIPKERQCQIYTNLGNTFSFIGRFVEAQEYWNKALNIIPNFPMAIGNKGNELFHYGFVLFDELHKAIYITYVHHYLNIALDLRAYLEGNAEQGFQN
ncbi:MAG: tetratricopeptide repeat protein [Bacteroidetes bacterium]|nr:tetratricopeptide repeat protein [Bacteroidota bacterium]